MNPSDTLLILTPPRYNPNTPRLLESRHECRGLTRDYNDLDTRSIPYDKVFETRLQLLRKLCGKVGDGTFVEPPFMPDYGCNIIIGSNCFINWKYVTTHLRGLYDRSGL